MKRERTKVKLSEFKIVNRYFQDSPEEEIERFKRLIQLIFPHLSSSSDQGLPNFSEKPESEGKP